MDPYLAVNDLYVTCAITLPRGVFKHGFLKEKLKGIFILNNVYEILMSKMMRSALKRTQDVLFSMANAQQRLMSSTMYDPPYLDSLKPKIPLYEPLNIQIKGYDFAIVENYQKEINRIAKIMDIDISDGWAIPGVKHKIQKYKPNSTIVHQEYELVTYERNLQVVDLPSTLAPIFFQLIQAAQPQGTNLEVHEHLQEHEIIRYVPDKELIQLKSQLTGLGGPLTKKK